MLPRIIHQMWIGPPLPLHIHRMMQTWREHHPDWEYRLWTDAILADYPLVNADLWRRAEEITPKAPWQFRSDVARYEILYHHGGIWADADFVCQRNFEPLTLGEFAGLETTAWLNNALIGAEPQSALMFDLIARLPQNVARHDPEKGNTVKSGPQFFTPHARRHKITEYPRRYFYPYLWSNLAEGANDYPDSFAVHHWNHQREVQGKPFATV